jgi:hypothetical protein
VTVGMTGPIGSGLPQFGFPRRLAMKNIPSCGIRTVKSLYRLIPRRAWGIHPQELTPQILAPRPLWKLLIIIGVSM